MTGLDLNAYAKPGLLARIGRRRRLNLRVAGDGPATVVLAAGVGGFSLDWIMVQAMAAPFARTVSFDPPGAGFSDPGPLPRTPEAMVADLRAALSEAGLRPPYVLVGHSAGGVAMRVFAEQQREDVAGLILLDSVFENWERRLWGGPCPTMVEARDLGRRISRRVRQGPLTPESTDWSLYFSDPLPQLPPALAEAVMRMRLSPAYHRAIASATLEMARRADRVELPATGAMGDLPLIVITAERLRDMPIVGDDSDRQHAWRAMHDELAALSIRGERRSVDCGHNIPLEAPGAVVAAVKDLVFEART